MSTILIRAATGEWIIGREVNGGFDECVLSKPQALGNLPSGQLACAPYAKWSAEYETGIRFERFIHKLTPSEDLHALYMKATTGLTLPRNGQIPGEK